MRYYGVKRLTISVAVALIASPSIAMATDDGNVFTDVGESKSYADALKTINSYLGHRDKVLRCSLTIESHPGKIENIYAGICRQKSGQTVLVCGDTGIGESGLKPTDSFDASLATRKELIDFVGSNCPGG